MRIILFLTKNLNFCKINLTPLYVNTCDINEKHVISNEVEGTSRYIKSKNGETAKLILTYYFILKLLVKQRS